MQEINVVLVTHFRILFKFQHLQIPFFYVSVILPTWRTKVTLRKYGKKYPQGSGVLTSHGLFTVFILGSEKLLPREVVVLSTL